jgi:flagellar P-ring protein precursor FlgI
VPGKLRMNDDKDTSHLRRRVPARGLTFAVAIVAAILAAATGTASASSRIKDLVDIEGVRDNQLVGYGLVVGLNNTGDTLREGSFTQQSLQSMLNRLGVKPTNEGLTSKNVAAVMITANLPAFARQGTRIDVSVSALGDADNLQGGTLLVTPLLGAAGEV